MGRRPAGHPSRPRLAARSDVVRRLVNCARTFLPLAALVAFAVVGCIRVYHELEVDRVEVDGDAQAWEVEVPVRAYLVDGSVVVLPAGASVRSGRLEGEGERHALTLESAERFTGIPLDSVIAVEAFRDKVVDLPLTILGAAASAAGAYVGSILLLVAIFGSCPTVYALEPGGAADEAPLVMEAFSYSIAPLFESRDVAAIPVAPDPDGYLRLEIRNEALETHYVRHMELLEVSLEAGERVLPDPTGRPLALSGTRGALSAVDRDGRTVTNLVREADGRPFRSSRSRLAAAAIEDFHDHLELEFEVAEGVSEAALELVFRNTLLNTVLFYDVMLGASGAAALDWLGRYLDQIGTAAALGRWYGDRMGMRVQVGTPAGWAEVAHLSDVGPIAWKEVAVPLPVHGPRVRVRLSFPSDAWFIDRVQIATGVRLPPVRVHPVAVAERADGSRDPEVVGRLSVSDTLHHVTYPGERYRVAFRVGGEVLGETVDGEAEGVASRAAPRSGFLLAMQGYYVEWVRGSWLRAGGGRGVFEPEDSAILEAMARWLEVMDPYERDFHASRIPVRR